MWRWWKRLISVVSLFIALIMVHVTRINDLTRIELSSLDLYQVSKQGQTSSSTYASSHEEHINGPEFHAVTATMRPLNAGGALTVNDSAQQASPLPPRKNFYYFDELGSAIHMEVKRNMDEHLKADEQCVWGKNALLPCSFSVIRSYMETCGYFPSQLIMNSYDKPRLTFCRLLHTDYETFVNYFHENINRIVTVGDSQGARYTGAMIAKLNENGITCTKVKSEPVGFTGRKDYFFQEPEILKALIDPERKCRTCTSFTRSCQVPATSQYKKKTISIEYISMIMHNLNATIINRDYCNSHPDLQICQYESQTEVIFKYYLNMTSYPDLFIIYPTFAHDVWEPLNRTIPNIRYLNNLIRHIFPANSKILCIPASGTNYRRFPFDTPDGGVAANERVAMFNHLLYDDIMRLNKEGIGPTFYGYFDIGAIGRQREYEWAEDLVHFIMEFYYVVADTLVDFLPTLADEL